MKIWILIPFVLVLGFMLGGWGPKSELSDLRKENKSLRKAIKNRESSQTHRISGITQLLGIEEQNRQAESSTENQTIQTNKHSQESTELVKKQEKKAETTDTEVESEDSEELAQLGEDQSETNSVQQDSFEERMEKAAELWAARVDISRSVFISNVSLSDEEAANFDTLVVNMNASIGQTITDFAEDIKDAEMVQPEAGIRLANDIMTSLVDTYDAIDNTMPEDWRRKAGKDFTLTDFIDPQVAMPLGKVENKFSEGQWE